MAHPPTHSHKASLQRRRRLLLTLLLAWPVVCLIGLGLNRIADSHAPAATLPVLWLLIVAYVIERMHQPHR